jgi:hypothetical protein
MQKSGGYMPLSPAVHDGLRKFIRLTALASNPQYTRRIRDEFDLLDALEVVRNYFHETKSMVGLKMYKAQPFDVIEDVKRATEEHFLSGREAKDAALARGKNLTMYHLAIVPIIEMFKGVNHEVILKNIDNVLTQVKDQLHTLEIRSHIDDALVTLAQVSVMIKQREDARKLELAKRRRVKRKKKTSDVVSWVERKEKDESLRF